MRVLEPLISDAELQEVTNAITSGKFSQGNYVEKFEANLAKYLGVKPSNVVVVSSGTAALHLAYILTPKKTLTMPACTFISTGNMAKHAGKNIEFVDVDKATWNSNNADVGVDLFGNPLTYDPLIEDAAEALGSKTASNKKCGTLGEISVLSFFENKIITCGGEGGALVFKNSEKAYIARLLRQQGKDFTMPYHGLLAFNYRMTEMQAAFGLVQLSKLDEFVKRKREIHSLYRAELGSFALQEDSGYSNRWANVILLPVKKKIELINCFKNEGIPCRPTFKPLYHFSWLHSKKPSVDELKLLPKRFSMCERLWYEGICLASSVSLLDSYVQRVCELVKQVAKE